MSVSASPVHSIHEYGHGIYKVVTFKGVRDPDNVYFRNGEDAQHYDNKLDNSFSRARNMVLQPVGLLLYGYHRSGKVQPL